MLLEKEPLHNLGTIYASVNALRKGAFVYGGPQDSEFKCLRVSELQM